MRRDLTILYVYGGTLTNLLRATENGGAGMGEGMVKSSRTGMGSGEAADS